jgi:hypothetical protein
MKEFLINQFWFFIQEKIKSGSTFLEALDQTVNEQSDLWEKCKNILIRRGENISDDWERKK